MTIAEGDKLPEADLLRIGADGPEIVSLSRLAAGRKIVLFGVPGAFTPTCHSAHVPSFIRTKGDFEGKGVEEIVCVAVNDPFVMKAWGEASGATEAGITMLADPEGKLAKAMGLDFTAPPVGLIGRTKRFALIADDGVVRKISVEDNPGECGVSGGEALLEAA